MRRAAIALALASSVTSARARSFVPLDEDRAPAARPLDDDQAAKPPPELRTPISWSSLTGFAIRPTDGWRWELGTGVSVGWRALADLKLRKYGNDAAVSAGLVLRFDLVDLTPRVAEVELAARIAHGKLMLAGNVPARVHAMFTWGMGAARLGEPSRYSLTGGIGLGVRVVPSQADWLMFEIGVRESYAPHVDATGFAARAATAGTGLAWSLETEASLSVSMLWPPAGRTCRPMRASSPPRGAAPPASAR